MGNERMIALPLIIVFFSLLIQRPTFAAKQSYVVYLGGHSHSLDEASSINDNHVAESHYQFLGSFVGGEEKARDAIFQSYTKSINGFAANLEEEEAMEIKKDPSVISVFPNRGRKLHTTRSWGFLGLERDGRVPKELLWMKARFGEDTIIANLDTGVWPESESFKDEGMGPVPPHWRGSCDNGIDKTFHCNRKLIGAKYYNKGFRSGGGLVSDSPDSPRDVDGHGSHTLSTAAGRFVPGASLFGHANGTAKGGSPAARVAAYKVCWGSDSSGGCYDADILSAFDAAIHDGVHVLSLSLGGDATDYFEDGIAIGSFHAVKSGITVICSGGNSGPDPWTVSNTAPWIITVAASTLDREFPSYFVLGNNKQFKGQTLSVSLPSDKFYPIISSEEANAANASREDAKLCLMGSLDPHKVKGKVVVCLRGVNARLDKGQAVLQAGGAGMVLANNKTNGDELIAEAHVLPAIHISYSDGLAVFSYLNSTKSPLGYIRNMKTKLGAKPAPIMALFSSQGPNLVTPEILKPDITAPGVNILAAYTGAKSPTDQPYDKRRVPFVMESGTSMSCPHVSGIAGLLKTLHPDWSPSAIKSAIITSARTRDNMGEPMDDGFLSKATPFSYGSGHIRPNRAMDPGLVYDLTTTDYLDFLCSIGYNSTQMATFSVEPYSCPSKPLKLQDFNYPSIVAPNLSGAVTVTRTVKNVGSPGTYRVRVEAPVGISVSVRPTRLAFHKMGEERKFEVTLKSKGSLRGGYAFGRLIWSDGKHFVRSPIVVQTKK